MARQSYNHNERLLRKSSSLASACKVRHVHYDDNMNSPELRTDQWRPIPQDVTEQELASVLMAAGIPIQDWAQGSAKTVEHLRVEIEEGESQIDVGINGEIRRRVSVIWVDVLYPADNGDVYILREDRQVYKDGRVRRRQLSTSLGEKMKPNEEPTAAVERALHEELGVTATAGLYTLGAGKKTAHTPDSYPGLKSHFKTYLYAAVISTEAFVAEGYVEEQADKTNYYVWELNNANANN